MPEGGEGGEADDEEEGEEGDEMGKEVVAKENILEFNRGRGKAAKKGRGEEKIQVSMSMRKDLSSI